MEKENKLKLVIKMILTKLAPAMVSISLRPIHRIGQRMSVKDAIINAFLIMVTCNAAAQSSTIGIIKGNSKDEWRLYSVRQIKAMDKIIVQFPGKGDRTDCCMTATLDSGNQKQKEVVVTDEYGDQEVWSYKLRSLLPVNGTRPFIGIAIIGDVSYVHGDGGLVRSMNGGKTFAVNSCLGAEGVHVLARDGKNLSAHLYLNLGYSVSPTCTDEMLE